MKSGMMWVNTILEWIKQKLNIIQKIINTTSTPDEYLQKKLPSPAVNRSNAFLSKHSIEKINNLQLFDKESEYYERNGYVASVLFYYDCKQDLLVSFLNNAIKHPKTTISMVTILNESSITNLIVTQEELPKKNKNKKNDVINKLIEKQKTLINDGAEVVDPLTLCNLIRKEYYNLPDIVNYQQDVFINEQLRQPNEAIETIVHSDLVIEINSQFFVVFFSKEYPNLEGNRILTRLMDRFHEDKFNIIHSLNCFKSEEGEDRVSFIQTLILKTNSKEQANEQADLLYEYLYQTAGWYIARNKGYPLQQFLTSMPFQFDSGIAKIQSNYTICNSLPVNVFKELMYYEN